MRSFSNVPAKLAEALTVVGSPSWPIADAVHDYQNVYRRLLRRLELMLGDKPLSECRILDLGCGYTYPNTALLHSAGLRVSGVDVQAAFFRDGRRAAFRSRRAEKGYLKACYHAGPRYSCHATFFTTLSALAGRPIDHMALDIRRYDGHRLPFSDGSFDVVISNAVLEHVRDLPLFVSETSRVMRPGAVLDMLWHNFYAPSGGHLQDYEVAQSPWGHVTGESHLCTYLNRKRPHEIRNAFDSQLEVLRIVGASKDHSLVGDPAFSFEGDRLLDESWIRRLPDIPREEFVTRSYLIQATKPSRA